MLRSGLIADVAVVAAVTVEVDVEGRLKSTMVSVSFPCSDLTGTDGASACLVIAEGQHRRRGDVGLHWYYGMTMVQFLSTFTGVLNGT